VAAETVTRVHYRERQFLRAADLETEQGYHLAMRRRHNIAHHDWGIVAGLGLEHDAKLGGFWLKAGAAVDGLGRELVVPEDVLVDQAVLDAEDLGGPVGDQESRVIDVWLKYARVAETPPQRGRWACGPGQHTRWREEAHLLLTLPQEDEEGEPVTIQPRCPPQVSSDDRDFGPHRAPPDDPARLWPVYLGRVLRTQFSVEVLDEVARPYIGLVGEVVTAPSGRAQMQVGGEQTAGGQCFAVGLPDETGALVDRIAVDRSGNSTIRGATRLASNLRFDTPWLLSDNDFVGLCSLALKLKEKSDLLSKYLYEQLTDKTKVDEYDGSEPPPGDLRKALVDELNRVLQGPSFYDEDRFSQVRLRKETWTLLEKGAQGRDIVRLNRYLLEDGYPDEIARENKPGRSLVFGPLPAAPDAPAPWQIYRTVVSPDDKPIHQLRIEIGHPGEQGDPADYHFVIGLPNSNDDLDPLLTVRADCTVIFHCNVKVVKGGRIVEGPIQADPSDPRFAVAILNRWLGGISSAATTVDTHYNEVLEVLLENLNDTPVPGDVVYQIVVRNTSRANLSEVEVYETYTLTADDGAVIRQPATLVAGPFSLGPGASNTKTRTVSFTKTGTLTMAVTALGLAPGSVPISASIEKTVQLSPGGL
jgi:hypothetical protein